MPIKTEYQANLPYLIRFTPYEVPSNVSAEDSVSGMFTYDLRPNTSNTIINYSVGAVGTFETLLTVKNITSNVTLQISLTFNNNVFAISSTENVADDSSTLVDRLLPGQSKMFVIRLRKSRLNSYANYEQLITNIELSVKNLSNGTTAFRNLNESLLLPNILPATIEVY